MSPSKWKNFFAASTSSYAPPAPRSVWTLWAILFTSVLGGLLAYALWREPFPIREVNAFVADASSVTPLESFWINLIHPFYIRPVHWGLLSLLLQLFGNTKTAIAVFEILHASNIVLLLAWIVYYLRPTSMTGFLATVTALTCFIGMPSFRGILESLPLNPPFMILLLGFPCLTLLQRPYKKTNDVIVLFLCATALLTKEQGMIVPVIVSVGFIVGFRGISKGGFVGAVVLLLAYIVYRLIKVGDLPVFHAAIGLFFTSYSSSELIQHFGDNPYPIYLYNVIATAMNTLFSEPSRGQFLITQAVLEGRADFWQVSTIIASLASTSLIFLWGLRRTIQTWQGMPNTEWRLFVMFLAALGVSSLCGFNYTLDRFGGVVGGFYALSLAFALKWALDSIFRAERGWLSFSLTVISLACITTLWSMRAASTLVFVRQSAWEARKEWIYLFDQRFTNYTKGRDDINLYTLLLYKDQGMDPTTPSTSRDPRWIEFYFGSRE